ncbi:MFS transporter [Cryobacterium sp. Hz9]|uniref:MFS transporter n=1 Tax=Cryobacterium sp. Hz9 TaxID=1259167 RepID=UPI00106B9C16|nr:MFS transporter [Cryobacterium sp. Hz9]TFB71604.1 MFS transporter [Cryobacterium sp. Hz9]
MPRGTPAALGPSPARKVVAPLYLAGFTTAFGAHGIAAALGVETGDIGLSILTFGILLAVYDLAEVVLKPVFGSLSDRIGSKPVIVGGLIAFAAASFFGIFAGTPILLGVARLGQGAAAAAFSPASSAAVARLAGPGAAGRYFGKYGSWKGLGYALGPLIGAALVGLDGLRALFIALTILGAATAIWVIVAVPRLPVLPRLRYTLRDLAKQTVDRSFLIPTLVLAASTGALGVAVGFLPLLGTTLHLGLFGSMGAVTVLAIASTLTQPFVGRLRDDGRISTRAGTTVGLLLIATGIGALAVIPTPATLYLAALTIGTGIGLATPLAFAHLAATTPAERMGRTMGNAELGREVGDAGGPLLVGAIASTLTLGAGLGVLAILTVGVASLGGIALRTNATQERGLPV